MKLGERVVEAAIQAEAASEVLDRPVDLVLTDINMPGLDGLRAVAALGVFGVHLHQVSSVELGTIAGLDLDRLEARQEPVARHGMDEIDVVKARGGPVEAPPDVAQPEHARTLARFLPPIRSRCVRARAGCRRARR